MMASAVFALELMPFNVQHLVLSLKFHTTFGFGLTKL